MVVQIHQIFHCTLISTHCRVCIEEIQLMRHVLVAFEIFFGGVPARYDLAPPLTVPHKKKKELIKMQQEDLQ